MTRIRPLVMLFLAGCSGTSEPAGIPDAGMTDAAVPDDARRVDAAPRPDAAPATPEDADLVVDAGPDAPAPVPVVVTTSPVDGAGQVDRARPITIWFSQDMDPASIDMGSIMLGHDASTDAASLTVNGGVVTMAPTVHLVPGKRYTVTVTTRATSLAGRNLAALYQLNFTAADPGWSPAVSISGTGEARYPRVALDSIGRAAAVWSAFLTTYPQPWTRPFAPSTGWQTASGLDTGAPGVNTAIAMNPRGDAIVAWEDRTLGLPASIKASMYHSGRRFDLPSRLEPVSSPASIAPEVAIDPNGNAAVVWARGGTNGVRSSVWISRYGATTGWIQAVRLNDSATADAGEPTVAADALGNMIAVWSEFDDVGTRGIFARRFSAGVPGSVIRIDGSTADAFQPDIAMSAGGTAVVVWQAWPDAGTGMTYHVASNRYLPTTGWDSASDLAPQLGHAWFPKVALDPAGNAFAIWQDQQGSHTGIWVARYTSPRWAPATAIDSALGTAAYPSVAMDAAGNAFAVWQQPAAGHDSVWSSRFTGSWSPAELREHDDLGDVHAPTVACDADGDAIAIWWRSDPVSTVWSTEFR